MLLLLVERIERRKKFRRFLLSNFYRTIRTWSLGWPVFTIRDHGLKGKRTDTMGSGPQYFTMPHERARVRESFSRGLAIASKRSSIAPSEDEFRDAANDVGHSHARKRSPRESLHHDFIVPRPWTLPCVIERVVKNKGGHKGIRFSV